MKRNILFVLVAFILFLTNCKSDNFYETYRILSTDKNMYCVGDSIFLTIKIMPQKGKTKQIRIFEDLRNIKIFPYSKSAVIDNDFYAFDKSGKINTFTITKDNYFEKILRGKITADENQIKIDFEGYDDDIILDKSVYFESPDLGIGGICLPIKPEFKASLEETFQQTKIAILDCEKTKRPVPPSE